MSVLVSRSGAAREVEPGSRAESAIETGIGIEPASECVVRMGQRLEKESAGQVLHVDTLTRLRISWKISSPGSSLPRRC